MSTFALTLRQVRYENLAFWRNPPAAFFTFIFPLMFLIIFNLLFGNDEIEVRGGTTNASTFYVPAIAALSIVSACFTNVAMRVTFSRDQGVLKRVRGTPLPGAAFLAGRIVHSALVGVLLVAVVAGFGYVFYDVDLPTNTMPALVVTLLIGSAAFCALGLAMSGFIANAEAAPAVVNGVVLPLLFISDVFIRADDAPGWLNAIATVFPVKHLSEALQMAFNPFEHGAGFDWVSLGVMALWGVAGALIAVRKFSWEPRA